jgi:hypothetical protein
MVEIKERIYYSVGKVALAIARSDGEIDASEMGVLNRIIAQTEKEHTVDLTLIYNTFEWFENSDYAIEQLVIEGIQNFHLGDDYLTPKLAKCFKYLLIEVAKSQPPITGEDDLSLTKFLDFIELKKLQKTRSKSN